MDELLLLSHRIPFPPDKGDKIRVWNVLRHLAQRYRIHLGCLIDDPSDWVHLPYLRSICGSVGCFESGGMGRHRRLGRAIRALMHWRPGQPLTTAWFCDPRLQRWVDDTLAAGHIRRAYVFCSAMAPYVWHWNGLRILDMVDIDSEKWRAYATGSANWPMRALWAREGRTLLRFERSAVLRFDRTLLVTADECRRFAELAPEAQERIDWVENGVDLVHFAPDQSLENPFDSRTPAIVMTGRMDYRPNADAAIWFARRVMPLLRGRRLAPHFHVVGANPRSPVRRLAVLPGVYVTGRVADPRCYMAHARVVVAPLRIARGIQNKVLEAMAMGRPIVASPQAFQGVRAVPGRDLLVADGAKAMARAVAEVLDGHHPDMGPSARANSVRNYNWDAALHRLDRFLENPGTRP